jgi:MFS family permease
MHRNLTGTTQSYSRAWFVVVLLWFVVTSNYFARLMPTAMHDSLVAAIPMSETQFGLLTSVALWAYGLMSPFAGFLADRFSRSRVIITSMFLWSALTWLTSYARTFEQLIILRSLMGLSEAFYLPAALALVSDYHSGPTRSLATGVHQSGYVIGMGLSGLGGWLAEQYSWHYAFSLVGLAGIAYCVPLAFLLRDAPQESASGTASADTAPKVRIGEALISLFSRGSFALAIVNWAVLGATAWVVLSWMPVFLQMRFQLTQGFAGLSATGYMNAAAVPGLFIGGFWADKWSKTNSRSRMFVPAIGLLVASPGLLLTAGTNVFILAILGLVVYRLFLSFADANMMPILCEIVDRRYRATSLGLLNLTNTVAGGFGIYLCGALRDLKVNLSIIFAIIAAVSAISTILFYFMKPKRP